MHHETRGKLTWVEAMPRAICKLMDMPRADGLSPYNIVTGRDRCVGGAPQPVLRECVRASAVYRRQDFIDFKVPSILYRQKVELRRRRNVDCERRQPCALGDKVWVRNPTTPLGPAGGRDELDAKWYGPCEVFSRVGDTTYNVCVDPVGTVKVRARHQLKPYEDDVLTGVVTPLQHIAPRRLSKHSTLTDLDDDDGVCERIVDVRWNPSLKRHEFLVNWLGWSAKDNSYEP